MEKKTTVQRSEKEREEERKQEEKEEEKDRAIYDHYDFTLQFRCYILADKLQAPGFMTLILKEIRFHGEFCNPRKLKVDNIRYAYQNTSHQDDPLRRLCLKMKCAAMHIEQTYSDSGFIDPLEEGGPLVRDVMKAHARRGLRQMMISLKEYEDWATADVRWFPRI